MKRIRHALLGALALTFAASPALLAQTSSQPMPAGPPKVLRIYREELKPGKTAIHARVEAGYVRAFARANAPNHYLAIQSMSGPSEAWFLEGSESFAEVAEKDKTVEKNAALVASLDQLDDQDGAFRSGQRGIIAVLRPDLSYRTETMNVVNDRYFWIDTVRIRMGFAADYVEAEKLGIEGHKKANITQESWATYEVVAGMPAGTFLVFSPMKSLADGDYDHGDVVQKAIGDDATKRRRELTRAAVIGVDSNIFSFSPGMSYLPAEWIAADPAFWAPKTTTAATKPAAKPPAKPAAGGN